VKGGRRKVAGFLGVRVTGFGNRRLNYGNDSIYLHYCFYYYLAAWDDCAEGMQQGCACGKMYYGTERFRMPQQNIRKNST
jgi:hypothetical protein